MEDGQVTNSAMSGVANGNPLLFRIYGLAVTGGVVILLLLCLILVCLSLAYRSQRHRGNPFAVRVQLVEERVTGLDLYDDVVSVRRSVPASTAHNTGQTGSGNEATMPHKYEEVQLETRASQGDTSHSVVRLEDGEIKNPVYNEVDGNGDGGGGSGTQPPPPAHDERIIGGQSKEQYSTLVQVGGRSSNDHVSVLQQESTPTYAMLK